MFGVALDIKLNDFKRLFESPKASMAGLLLQFILLPAITYLLILILNPLPSIALGMIMVAACPGGNISNFMTHLARGNTALSVTLTSFGTVLAIFMTPINLELWSGLYAPTSALLKGISLDPIDVFKNILLLIGVPLVAGMVLNHKKPLFAKMISQKVKPVSILIFIAFILIAFSNNYQNFINHIGSVVWIVLIHNASSLALGYYFARLSGLEIRDCKTLAIETGIQNSGLGLLLIFSFFNGLGGMAIVAAWWGLWHIVSGLALASFWSGARTFANKAA
jgi:BASS family bile acid:Na+ symporter